MDTTIHVALLAEGVDRNGPWDGKYIVKQASPSSRRAWIEIAQKCCFWRFLRSPSSRRAWIEIPAHYPLRRKRESRPPRGGRG